MTQQQNKIITAVRNTWNEQQGGSIQEGVNTHYILERCREPRAASRLACASTHICRAAPDTHCFNYTSMDFREPSRATVKAHLLNTHSCTHSHLESFDHLAALCFHSAQCANYAV